MHWDRSEAISGLLLWMPVDRLEVRHRGSMGYDDGECGDVGDWEKDSEIKTLDGGSELDAGWPGYSSLAADPGHLRLRSLRPQKW